MAVYKKKRTFLIKINILIAPFFHIIEGAAIIAEETRGNKQFPLSSQREEARI